MNPIQKIDRMNRLNVHEFWKITPIVVICILHFTLCSLAKNSLLDKKDIVFQDTIIIRDINW